MLIPCICILSMRVRPEVSELSNEGSVVLNNFKVPALTTRRAGAAAAWLHGRAADLAGHTALVAGDLVGALPTVLRLVAVL